MQKAALEGRVTRPPQTQFMIQHSIICLLLLTIGICHAEQDERADAIIQLKKIGGHVFEKKGRVVEINLNGNPRADDQLLKLVSQFRELTDLSLEGTNITDAGIMHLKDLKKLEWLNLYRTNVGDPSLATLSTIKSLKHLPIGETNVTDKGLEHLAGMAQLVYLGFRKNKISDAGVSKLKNLKVLQGLHLGETQITDASVQHLLNFPKLKKLWLHDTQIGDSSVNLLAQLKSLKFLAVSGTEITPAAIKTLQTKLPKCEIE